MPGTIQTQQTAPEAPQCRGIYHLTHPRSASNLFQTMMAKQPGFEASSYKLFEAGVRIFFDVEKGPLSTWPEEERKELQENFQKAFDEMQDEMEEAEKKGKRVLFKEHATYMCATDKLMRRVYEDDETEPMILRQRGASLKAAYTNPTSLPDDFLLSLQPIFQIRNPVLMFPSLVRAQTDMKMGGARSALAKIGLTLEPQRALYDWYLERSRDTNIIPRVIDADDVMNEPETVRRLCLQTGLDPDAVVYEWETRHYDNPLKARFFSTIGSSRGIIPGLDAKGKSVQTEMEKWVKEFGQEDADGLAKRVRDAMPDYEYLYSRRTVAE
ncbi:hypothetical protein ACJQWK_03960 [Exserohilum turcicum]